MTAADPTYGEVRAAMVPDRWMSARQVAEAIPGGGKLSLVKRRLWDLVEGSRLDVSTNAAMTGVRGTAFKLRPETPRDPAVIVTGGGA